MTTFLAAIRLQSNRKASLAASLQAGLGLCGLFMSNFFHHFHKNNEFYFLINLL
jgi:hypothetical protein